ncbi:hypothetical protein AAE250_09905 [Bacteroides sp. GD17]|jgi:hypothetical protein|uniref:hypothetical protein n=1 Tax=Bacteroides sp. GD17 TaxID=3139826 RepID=UPI0025F88D9D|nr:hypothetical protein [uncultured Bacteroides sp.]
MENNNQPEVIQEPSYKQLNLVSSSFQSEEAMKAYYLQMADTMAANLPFEKCSEYISLKGLRRKLKQFIGALQQLSVHEWGSGIAEIQNACGTYMLQSNIERKLLLQTNREIGRHMQFITQLAGNMGFIKQLLGTLNCHYQNVRYLMERMKE